MKSQFERDIEAGTGQTIEHLRDTPLDELRREQEVHQGHPLTFASFFPVIGRGHALRDRLVSHEEAERAFKDAIRKLA